MSAFGDRDIEAQLLRRAQGGDDAAIEELLRRWQPALVKIARALNRRHARLGFDTHDLVSTTFRRLLRIGTGAIANPDGRKLLATILRDAYADKVRDAKGRQRREAEAARLASPAREPTPPGGDAGFNEVLPTGMQRDIDPDDWALIMLWKQGHSWAQIGQTLQLTPETARARWHRLMRRLRETRSPKGPSGASASARDSEAPRAEDRSSDQAEDRDLPFDPTA